MWSSCVDLQKKLQILEVIFDSEVVAGSMFDSEGVSAPGKGRVEAKEMS